MKTRVFIYEPESIDSCVIKEYDKPRTYDELNVILREHFGENYTEHVTVLFDPSEFPIHWQNGKIADMFVDENGLEKKLKPNLQATTIYLALTTRNLGQDECVRLFKAGEIGCIVGKAIVFEERVWN